MSYKHSTLTGSYLVSIDNNNITVSKSERCGYTRVYRPVLEETYPTTEESYTRFLELLTKAQQDAI